MSIFEIGSNQWAFRPFFRLLFLLSASACVSNAPPPTVAETAGVCIRRINDALDADFALPTGHQTPAAMGDFNGDGVMDTACLGTMTGADKAIIFVAFGPVSDESLVVPLERFSPDAPPFDIRILRKPPGAYPTYCRYAPDECPAGAPLELKLDHDSLLLVVIEASAILIYWDEASQSFKREWLAD